MVVVRRRRHELSDSERDTFEDMLRSLTVSRRDIRRAMLFALDHAECAEDVRRSQTKTVAAAAAAAAVAAAAAALAVVLRVTLSAEATMRDRYPKTVR